MENAARRARVQRMIRPQPRTPRIVVFLREGVGLTAREVGHMVGIPEANVEQRLHRARVLLRAGLEGVELATSLRQAVATCRPASAVLFRGSCRMHKATARAALVLVLALAPTLSVRAWNGTGHQIVARIAWDTMTPTVRERVVALLQSAPPDACLAELMPTDARPLTARRREFFLRASTWADIVRPANGDARPCTRFHRSEWHHVNFFWQGVSGATGADRPADRSDMRPATPNLVAQLPLLRALATCAAPHCGTTTPERAIALAWILHLVGDIHQPLHTSARVTARPDERQGDQGGNLFILDSGPPILRLHGYWDGIVDRSEPRGASESNAAYIGRLAALFMQRHPPSTSVAELAPGQYEAWAFEGFETTKASVYPVTLKRGEVPGEQYRQTASAIAQRAIARAGYRLGALLNAMFG